MARTKSEVRAWLNKQVGKKVNAKAGIYNGQCVSLIKALLEYLGAPNPYKARGNAKDYGDTILREGIAKNGDGWLRVVVNRNMGGGYGHIWIDLAGEANYEQNGARALYTTKNTRPYSHRQQVVNLDKYIKAEPKPKPATKRVAQKGTFTAYYNMNIRRSPSGKGQIAGILKKGESVKYDSYIDREGIRWISYVGYSGKRNYIARRTLNNKTIYGKAY